jgi:LemA protein
MMQLSEELTSTENRIGFARQAFNDGVTAYNTAREKFPASVIASLFQFQAGALLEETQPEVRNAPRVSFN